MNSSNLGSSDLTAESLADGEKAHGTAQMPVDRCESCKHSFAPCRKPGDDCHHKLRWLARHPNVAAEKRAVMQQAIEALESLTEGTDKTVTDRQKGRAAIAAMRAAIARATA